MYKASLHTGSAKPLGLSSAAPDSARTWFYDETAFLYRPFKDLAEVLAYLDTPQKRTGAFSIHVNEGGTFNPGVAGFGAFTGGTFEEYWFKNGVVTPVKKTRDSFTEFASTKAEAVALSINKGTWVRVAVDESNNGDKSMYLYDGTTLEFQYTIS